MLGLQALRLIKSSTDKGFLATIMALILHSYFYVKRVFLTRMTAINAVTSIANRY